MSELEDLLTRALDDHRHGWSIGTFGAVGEFVREENELTQRRRDGGIVEFVTARGAIRVAPLDYVKTVAFDTLSSDGETWNQAVAFCLPKPPGGHPGGVHRLGPDKEALCPEDRTAILYDVGVGLGHVRMCIRTRDEGLVAALDALQGKSILGPEGAKAAGRIQTLSPNRVMLSPIGRIEIYTAIPGPGGQSPLGPHTHLLPKLIANGRTHAANAPIPEGLQPVLMLHPRSPWRNAAGERTPFAAELNDVFESMLQRYGLSEDREIRRATEHAVQTGSNPQTYDWPSTRRGRMQARITLRRLAQKLGADRVASWRNLYDRTPAEEEDGAATAPH